MAPTYRVERDRGSKEFPQQLAVLRERWPLAFPTKHEDVRPLAMGVARAVAAAMSWSLPYTLGVLNRWKIAPVYCHAVLSYNQRIGLDGTPAEPVDAEAKDLATKKLAQLALHRAAKKTAEAVEEFAGIRRAPARPATRDLASAELGSKLGDPRSAPHSAVVYEPRRCAV
jgi:sRNA-binding protein